MRFFYKESVSSFKNNNGKEKKSFEIIKGKNGELKQIQGISNNNDPSIYHIHEKIQKINNHGILHSKQRSFKLKSTDIINLLKDEPNTREEIKDTKEEKKTNHELIKKNNIIKKDCEKKVKKPIIKKDIEKKVKKPISKKDSEKKVKKDIEKKAKKPISKKDIEKKKKTVVIKNFNQK